MVGIQVIGKVYQEIRVYKERKVSWDFLTPIEVLVHLFLDPSPRGLSLRIEGDLRLGRRGGAHMLPLLSHARRQYASPCAPHPNTCNNTPSISPKDNGEQ